MPSILKTAPAFVISVTKIFESFSSLKSRDPFRTSTNRAPREHGVYHIPVVFGILLTSWPFQAFPSLHPGQARVHQYFVFFLDPIERLNISLPDVIPGASTC